MEITQTGSIGMGLAAQEFGSVTAWLIALKHNCPFLVSAYPWYKIDRQNQTFKIFIKNHVQRRNVCLHPVTLHQISPK